MKKKILKISRNEMKLKRPRLNDVDGDDDGGGDDNNNKETAFQKRRFI